MQVDYVKQLQIDLSYVGNTGESSAATIIIHGSTTSGQHRYFKLPLTTVSYGEGADSVLIPNADWRGSDGGPANDAYSSNWNLEALLYKGNVEINQINSNTPVFAVAGYLLQTGSVTEGNIEGDIQTMIFPVTLNGEPLEDATTPACS